MIRRRFPHIIFAILRSAATTSADLDLLALRIHGRRCRKTVPSLFAFCRSLFTRRFLSRLCGCLLKAGLAILFIDPMNAERNCSTPSHRPQIQGSFSFIRRFLLWRRFRRPFDDCSHEASFLWWVSNCQSGRRHREALAIVWWRFESSSTFQLIRKKPPYTSGNELSASDPLLQVRPPRVIQPHHRRHGTARQSSWRGSSGNDVQGSL